MLCFKEHISNLKMCLNEIEIGWKKKFGLLSKKILKKSVGSDEAELKFLIYCVESFKNRNFSK